MGVGYKEENDESRLIEDRSSSINKRNNLDIYVFLEACPWRHLSSPCDKSGHPFALGDPLMTLLRSFGLSLSL